VCLACVIVFSGDKIDLISLVLGSPFVVGPLNGAGAPGVIVTSIAVWVMGR